MRISKDILLRNLIIVFVTVLLQTIFYISDCEWTVLPIICLLLEICIIISYVRKKLIFSPLVVSDLLLICMFFYQLGLVVSYGKLPIKATISVVGCATIWRIIHSYDKSLVEKLNENKTYDLRLNTEKFKKYILGMWIVAAFFMLLEWNVAGGIPALRADGEVFRFSVKINGITHMLAIMNKIVAILSATYIICSGKKIRKQKLMVFIFVCSTLMIYLTAMRGELVIILFVIAVLYSIKKKIKLWKLIILVAPILLFIGGYPIYRQYHAFGGLYVHDQIAISRYHDIWFLTPLYQTVSDGMRTLGMVTEMYPYSYSYGIINYSILSQIPFVNLGADVSVAIANYSNSHFYSGLTSTYLGPLFADGGVIACYFYTLIMAIWTKKVFMQYVKKRNMLYTILYAFAFYNCIMLCYGNTIIELSFVFYYTVIYFVCSSATKASISTIGEEFKNGNYHLHEA